MDLLLLILCVRLGLEICTRRSNQQLRGLRFIPCGRTAGMDGTCTEFLRLWIHQKHYLATLSRQ